MIGLLFILMPVAEIIVFIKVGDEYGYFNAFMALVVSFIVGLAVVQNQGRAFLMRAQTELVQGKLPANAVVQSALVFVGGLLVMLPGFISDFIGLLCIVPGPRHLIGVWARRALKRQLEKGRVHFFGNGGGFSAGFGGFGGQNQGNPFAQQQDQTEKFERDVSPKIIEVKARHIDDDDDQES